jgi:hypothetical protein
MQGQILRGSHAKERRQRQSKAQRSLFAASLDQEARRVAKRAFTVPMQRYPVYAQTGRMQNSEKVAG